MRTNGSGATTFIFSSISVKQIKASFSYGYGYRGERYGNMVPLIILLEKLPRLHNYLIKPRRRRGEKNLDFLYKLVNG